MANIYGTNRDDVLVPRENSDDFLFGFAGNDYLTDWTSEVGTNYMYGGDGHDSFESTVGLDHMWGGRGPDFFYISGNSERWVRGGPGRDVVFVLTDKIDHDGPPLEVHTKGIEEVVFL